MKRKFNIDKTQQVLDVLKEVSRDRGGLPDKLLDDLNTVRGETETMILKERERRRAEFFERKERREEEDRKERTLLKAVGGGGGGRVRSSRPDTRNDGAKLGTAAVNVIGSSHLRSKPVGESWFY